MYDRTTVRPYDRTTVQGATFNLRGELYRGHANATVLFRGFWSARRMTLLGEHILVVSLHAKHRGIVLQVT